MNKEKKLIFEVSAVSATYFIGTTKPTTISKAKWRNADLLRNMIR